ncbi:ABC transporter ATP-binding protein [Halobacterium bonnevillei]|uniref:Probable branched-chain amino acid transport ATP-binding protein LivG n=1 Tax=Halobacterium bonnevillei TaxID=2692200 RepID=A0A6B0SFL1_9EURY|nr:ABC transporter ATP-binding protein [Halobacterium bonnevillei]MXR20368.1 ATP-binding cassette domain-containing protein [Halobacterium bonnevillei]
MSSNQSPADGNSGDAAASADLLEVDGVVKQFGGLVAVDGVSFGVEEASITGLIGPNGAGKSTLFNCITGVYDVDGGAVRLDGEEIQGLSPTKVARRGVGRTFQTPKTFRGMTVRENMAFAARHQTGERALGALLRPGTIREEEADVQARVDDTLEFLELDHLADDYASGLSGGQRKLLELGRVLMLDPEIIMLDEPVAGVNPSLTDDLLARLRELNDRGRTILFIEHDMDVVMENCDRVVVMHNGQTLASGPPDIVQDDERVVEAYLGGVDR